MNHRKKWLTQAPLGLVLIGFGVSLVAEAAMLKYGGAPWTQWVPYGTVALVVLNSGLSVFGNSILHRVRYEREQDELGRP